MKLEQENIYKVSKKKWRNWPDICQRVFNETFYAIRENQLIMIHPEAKQQLPHQWDTVAWNSAWLAADACQKALKDIIKGKGYAK